MNNEIKEILRTLKAKSTRYEYCLKENISYNDESYEAHLLLNYITNLQHTEDLYNQLLKDYDEEVEENIKLTKLWKNEVEKRRKAVEYIGNNTRWFDSEYASIYGELCTCAGANANRLEVLVNPSNLLNILNSRSDE